MKPPPNYRDLAGTLASPPCWLHEVDPAYAGLAAVDPQQRIDVMRWRRAERERLIAARLRIDRAERKLYDARILNSLAKLLSPDLSGSVVSLYWPIRGEPDIRGCWQGIRDRGGRCALPVVIRHGEPLRFRPWSPESRLALGTWNIPEPATGDEVVPDILIAPVVGFDGSCFRLGYGGGFFDRTLAARDDRPRVYGVGYALSALPSIFPQPHDIQLNAIVTEAEVIHR